MATLNSSGFQLAALPRSPNIPANIGSVDVKAIYDGVRQGLATAELARTAPQSMALADATAEAQTAQAPLRTRQILAQSEEKEKKAPLELAKLAESVSPERVELERAALKARAVKPLTGTPYYLTRLDELRRAQIESPNDPFIAEAIKDTQLALNKASALSAADPNLPIKVAETNIAGRASEGKLDREFKGTQADTDRALKQQMQATDIAAREKLQAAELAARQQISAAQEANKLALVSAKTDQQRAAAGIKALTALESGKARTMLFNRTVDRAIENLTGSPDGVASDSKIPGWDIGSAVARVVGSYVPGSSAADLGSLIETLKAEAGFKELEQMRLAAPGGQGASGLGQVTEKELAYLQSRVANLKLAQSDKQLYDNIIELRDAVDQAWKNVQNAYDRTYGKSGATAPAAAAPQVSAEEKAAAAAWLEANPNDPRAAAVKAKAGL